MAAAGWWVAIVQLTPAADRPYIGGSQNNSLLNLIFGYNGFGRLTGNEAGSVGGGTGGSRWGATGLLRMFNATFGGQASWLIPAAVIVLLGQHAAADVPPASRLRHTEDPAVPAGADYVLLFGGETAHEFIIESQEEAR